MREEVVVDEADAHGAPAIGASWGVLLPGGAYGVRPHRQQAEEERAERDLEPESEGRHEERGLECASQRSEPGSRPLDRDGREPDEGEGDERSSYDEAVLEPEVAAEPFEERIPLPDRRAGVRPREDAELDDLRPHEGEGDEAEHGVDLPGAAEQIDGAGGQGDHAGEAEEEEEAARGEVEPARAVEEHEPDVPPGVGEAVELRLSLSGVVVDRNLAHAQPAPIRLEHHLGGELHPGGVEVETFERVPPERSHPAVSVRDLHAEEDVEESGEEGVPEVAVRPGHRSVVDAPGEAGAEHEVAPALERIDEGGERGHGVRPIGVGHDDVPASRDGEPAEVGAPVAADRLDDDGRSPRGGDLRRAIARVVVDDDDLSRAPGATDALPGLVHDASHRCLLVETRDDDGDLGGGLHQSPNDRTRARRRTGRGASLRALAGGERDRARASSAQGGFRGLASSLDAWIHSLSTASGLVLLVALALVVWILQSVAWPVVAGRDLGTYLRYYAQMWEWEAVFPQAMLGRTPGTPIVVGLALEAGPMAVELLMASLFLASVVSWTAAAAAFDRRAAAVVAAILLLYPGYGAVFHQLSSDALAAAGFALWSLGAVRLCLAPSAARFAALGAVLAALVLVRPAYQVVLAFALAPLVLAGPWRDRLVRSAAFLAAAASPLGLWAAHNAVRYEDFTVARGSGIVIPFARTFTEERIVDPENGPASRRLAEAVERALLPEEPYRSYGIDLETFFSSGSPRMLEDVASLSDRVFGWDSEYTMLREAGIEAIRAHPGAYGRGVARTLWELLRFPAYVIAPGSGSAADESASSGNGEGLGSETVVVDGRVLPRPSEGELIPSSHQALWVSTPDNRIREVWSSPTEHRLVFRDPADAARAARVEREMARLAARLPDRAGNAALRHRLNQAAYRFPPPALWLGVGLVAVAWRRPQGARIALLLASSGLLVLLVSALGLPAAAEYAMPVVPSFALLAGVGLLGSGRGRLAAR